MKILPLLLLVCLTNAVKVSYDQHKVYKVVPHTEEHVNALEKLRQDGYPLWDDFISIDSDVKIVVSPARDSRFRESLDSVGLIAEVSIDNLQTLIDDQLKPAINVRSTLGSFSWDRYHTLEEIHIWLDELAEMYPDVVRTVVIGTSNQGRELKGVVIDFKPDERGERPLTGMIEGGIHAREWISPATVTWIIKEFLTSSDSDVRAMAESFVWHIFPVVNPDGYVYTFTDNRMWRKNRNTAYTTTCAGNNDLSNGIDLNRNFDYVWMSIGASLNPCTETFAGPSAASEPETRAMSNYILNLKEHGEFIYYLDFHSYSQLTLVPYSHVTGYEKLQARNYGDLYEIAIRAADKIQARHGTQYVVGTSTDIMYAISGSSMDWVKGVVDVPIAYLFELRDQGQYGFLLPTNQIIPNNEETMDGLIEMDRVARKLGYYSSGSNGILTSLTLVVAAVSLLKLSI